jgi:hypothetical protein
MEYMPCQRWRKLLLKWLGMRDSELYVNFSFTNGGYPEGESSKVRGRKPGCEERNLGFRGGLDSCVCADMMLYI